MATKAQRRKPMEGIISMDVLNNHISINDTEIEFDALSYDESFGWEISINDGTDEPAYLCEPTFERLVQKIVEIFS